MSKPAKRKNYRDEMRYAGDKSRRFWKRVGALKDVDHVRIYALGCDLQNLEDHVLSELERAEKEARRAK